MSPDHPLEANHLRRLGELAVERLDAAAWAAVTQRRTAVKHASSGMVEMRFQLARYAAAYACDMDGDFDRAAGEARLAEEIAGVSHARVLALCSRAMVARLAGESVSHRDHVRAALALFDDCTVEEHTSTYRTLALNVAQEAVHGGFHAEAVAAFGRSRAAEAPARHVHDGVRFAADAKFVEAHILSGGGEPERAGAALEAAFSAYRSLSYTRRSIMSALQLAALRPRDPSYDAYVSVAVERLSPASWMRRAAADSVRRGTARKLTPAQRALIALICEGCTNGEIAGRRGTSEHTVRNQIARLFDVLSVRSRSELTALAVRQGFDTA
jgi:DNA-binding NarL/FixJ family response regulator